MKKINIGSDFSGVGAFNQALQRLKIYYNEVFACDWNKYSRQTFSLNYGTPKYFPIDVYERQIPKESLDVYMTSPPCQAFSLAGKRKGEEDKRGVLFYNSHEFISKNKPRYFIIENVKGLLSDDSGKTFQRWIDFLGGKSVNGNPVIFPVDEAVPYHVYYQVLNSKNYGIPQNRERVFIIGIRDDADNDFSFPKRFYLVKRLKDVLESEVDEKYFLSDKMVKVLTRHQNKIVDNENPEQSGCIHAGYFKMGGRDQQYVKENNFTIQSNTAKGYDTAEEEEDSINFSVPNSETRRGRIGKGVSQTLDTQCNQGIATRQLSKQENDIINPLKNKTEFGWHFEQAVYDEEGITRSLKASEGSGNKAKVILNQRIRRLTPRECFRLMDFPETFKWDVSDSQAYKQAGNSICVGVLAAIISKLKL